MKYWEIIADNLSEAVGVGAVSQRLIPTGRTIWIADAHRDNGKRFIVRADPLTRLRHARSCAKSVSHATASPFPRA
jgi:hypothetical protein